LLSMHTLLLSHTHLCLHRSLSVSCVPFFCRSVSYFLIFIFFFLFTRQSFLHPLWQLTSLSLSLPLSLSLSLSLPLSLSVSLTLSLSLSLPLPPSLSLCLPFSLS